ncbi:MAG: hypothetical protein IIA70_03000 [Proteobacteria bacterium]|nr:hypothetical protein [Pseudomonadota bacterium]
MPSPLPKKQKAARRKLDELFTQAKYTWVIHYSCESLFDLTDGRSPRITSIALRSLNSAQTFSFSIHQIAERKNSLGSIESKYDKLEKNMLDEFYETITRNENVNYLHWNMKDINYGFAALEHRHKVLGGSPVAIADQNKFDLKIILKDIYGVNYIGNPPLEKLLEKNEMKSKKFMKGADEATAFENKDYVALHQSTLCKVYAITNIADRAHSKTLKTNASLWDLHGGSIRNFAEIVVAHPVWSIASFLATLVGLWYIL